MASIIARDDADHTVDATEVSFTPASWSVFSRRWISLARASTWVFLYLVSSRSSDVRRRHERRLHHPVRRHVGQPLGVGEVGLSTRDVLHVLSVTEPQLLEEAFEGVVDGPPIDPRCLHGHGAHPGIHEERRELSEALLGGREPPFGHLDIPVGHRHPGAGDHSVAVDVEAAHLVPDLLHVHLLVVGGHRERTTV